MLNSNHEDLVIGRFPEQLTNDDETLAKLLVFVTQRKTKISFPSSLAINKENNLTYTLTWMVSTINNKPNYSNTILTIS